MTGSPVDDETLAKLVLYAQIELAGGINETPVRLDEVHRLVRENGEFYMTLIEDKEKRHAWLREHGVSV